MAIFFKTEWTSKTGKKLAQLREKINLCFDAQKKMAEKYGFSEWRGSRIYKFGSISSCKFNVEPDKKIWRKGLSEGEFYPRRNSKSGIQIIQEFQEMPTISSDEVNKCVGIELNFLSCIGLNFCNDQFAIVIISDEWMEGFDVPEDLIEITYSEKNKLINHERNSNRLVNTQL